jgi:hypothetical protein
MTKPEQEGSEKGATARHSGTGCHSEAPSATQRQGGGAIDGALMRTQRSMQWRHPRAETV